jgi:glycerate-2-kinase
VTVLGGGRGGRNQELALSASLELEGIPGVALACFATDGVDGPTDAAGAVVDGETSRLGGEKGGVGAAQALADNDAYPFLAASGDLLWTGPTGTNVADIVIGLVFPS